MKLDSAFVQLPLRFDIDRLKVELDQFSENDWMPHTTRYVGNFSIPLISKNGEMNDDMDGIMRPTHALTRCGYIQQIMTTFDEVFGRSRLMRLDAGQSVPPHIDVNYHWYSRVRIHIPIVTNDKVRFFCDDQETHMGAGECWLFNSWMEHRVENRSDSSRVHLVLDTAGSARFWQLVSMGYNPFDAAAAKPDLKFIPFSPGAASRIRSETFNAPLVQSPGELERLAGDIIRDIVCTSPEDRESARTFIGLVNQFLKEWRVVWSEHGMLPRAWRVYRTLIQQTEAALGSINSQIFLGSNGAEAIGVFRSLVLGSAINETLAPLYLSAGPDDRTGVAETEISSAPGS